MYTMQTSVWTFRWKTAKNTEPLIFFLTFLITMQQRQNSFCSKDVDNLISLDHTSVGSVQTGGGRLNINVLVIEEEEF